MPSLEDRFIGCLVGLAAGDALGGPLEEVPKHPCQNKNLVLDMIGGGWLKLLPGQITDDTEMALCVARSIAEKEMFNPADIAKRFVEWYNDSPIGAGRVTGAAIERLKQGVPWQDTGVNKLGLKKTTNGSVMRCAPIALLDYNRELDRAHHTHDQGIITHPHYDCIISCEFLNTLIAGALQGIPKDQLLPYALKDIPPTNLALRFAAIPSLHPTTVKISGDAVDTVESAVHSFLYGPSFESAVGIAVNYRGDADTRGAVCGAIAGAYYGKDDIPLRWSSKLVDRHGRPVLGELENIAKKLYLLAHR